MKIFPVSELLLMLLLSSEIPMVRYSYLRSESIHIPTEASQKLNELWVHHTKCWAGWLTSWSQDCREKYQQPQICRWADDSTLMAESEELKSLLIKVKEESEKVGLKLNIQKMKIMAFGHITSWQIDGEKVETMTNFILLGSKINGQWLQPWN